MKRSLTVTLFAMSSVAIALPDCQKRPARASYMLEAVVMSEASDTWEASDTPELAITVLT